MLRYEINEGIGDFIVSLTSETLGKAKKGITLYKDFNYSSTFMLIEATETIRKGDVVFIEEGFKGRLSSATPNLIGISVVNCPQGYACHVLLDGVVEVITTTTNNNGDKVYFKLPNIFTNEVQDLQLLGASFLDNNIIQIF